MAKAITFQLDLSGGEKVLSDMAMKTMSQSAQAVASRAQAISGVPISVKTQVGVIKRGSRAIATVESNGKTDHDNYKAAMAIKKSMDAGKV